MKAMFLLAGALVVAGPASAAEIDSSWIGRDFGFWNVSTNWSPTGVPNNGANTYNVIIVPRNPVTVNMDISAGVSSLTIGIFKYSKRS